MLKQKCTHEEEIIENMEGYIHDLGNTKARDTKFHKTMVLKWQLESLLSKALLDTKVVLMIEEENYQNHKLLAHNRRLEGKLKCIYKAMTRIDMPLEDQQQVQVNTMLNAIYKNKKQVLESSSF